MTEVCAPKMEYPKCDDVEACKKKEGEGDDRVPWWLVMILIMIPSVLLLVGLLLCKTVSTHTKIAKLVPCRAAPHAPCRAASTALSAQHWDRSSAHSVGAFGLASIRCVRCSKP